jgi:hypothetical protein
MTPVDSKDNIRKIEININRILIILIIILTFFLGRYSVPIEREIDTGFVSKKDEQPELIQEMIDKILMYDDLPVDNDLTRLQETF